MQVIQIIISVFFLILPFFLPSFIMNHNVSLLLGTVSISLGIFGLFFSVYLDCFFDKIISYIDARIDGKIEE